MRSDSGCLVRGTLQGSGLQTLTVQHFMEIKLFERATQNDQLLLNLLASELHIIPKAGEGFDPVCMLLVLLEAGSHFVWVGRPGEKKQVADCAGVWLSRKAWIAGERLPWIPNIFHDKEALVTRVRSGHRAACSHSNLPPNHLATANAS